MLVPMDKLNHVQLLLDSFQKAVGRNLIVRTENPILDLQFIENADFVLISHNNDPDPILTYGNPKALELWEMSWNEFTSTPSKETAEEENRRMREEMLEQAKVQGYFDNYEGVRVSKNGKRFRIKDALIWNLVDENGNQVGQAAVFERYDYL